MWTMLPLKLAAIITAVAYLFARIVFTWHGSNPALFVLLLMAETFGMWRLWVEISLIGRSRPETRTPDTGPSPSADAVVVVTDEPGSEVRAAVLSARLLEGVSKVWVVDRDDRRDVAELARRLSIRRVAGKPGCDLGPLVDKALSECASHLVVLIPADVVVLPDLVSASATSFADPLVAVVTCRVENANASNKVDHGGYGIKRIRDRLTVPKLDALKALPWFPGLAVVRREAVLECGGTRKGRSGWTLDAGLQLQRAGFRITEAPVVVARRLASWTDDRQVHRWARDLHERLALLRDSSRKQRAEVRPRLARLAYTSVRIHKFQPLQRLVLIGVLFATMYTSSLPLRGDVAPLFLLWGAWHVSSNLLRWAATREVGFTPWIIGDLRLMSTNLVVSWRVARGVDTETELVDRAPGRRSRTIVFAMLQLSLVGTIVVFGSGILRTAHGDFVTIAALWLALWLLVVSVQARSALRLRQIRQSFRTFEELPVIGLGSKMAVIGVSPLGIDVVSRAPMKVGDTQRIAFALPQGGGESVRFETSSVVRRSSREGRYYMSYLRFGHLSDIEFDQITVYCSVVAGEHLLRDEIAEIETDVMVPSEVVEEPETTDA